MYYDKYNEKLANKIFHPVIEWYQLRADEVGEGKEGDEGGSTISLNLETCQRLLRDRHKESGVDTGAIGSGGHIVY